MKLDPGKPLKLELPDEGLPGGPFAGVEDALDGDLYDHLEDALLMQLGDSLQGDSVNGVLWDSLVRSQFTRVRIGPKYNLGNQLRLGDKDPLLKVDDQFSAACSLPVIRYLDQYIENGVRGTLALWERVLSQTTG